LKFIKAIKLADTFFIQSHSCYCSFFLQREDVVGGGLEFAAFALTSGVTEVAVGCLGSFWLDL
jgi:hypothetical protein